MWLRLPWRRHPPPPPLPSLDSLNELVARVVDLLDGFVSQEHKRPPAQPEWHVQAVGEELVSQEHDLWSAGWVAFLGSATGYRLFERDGDVPARGDVVVLGEERFRVLRLGPSPLPGDERRCAFLEREEPPLGARNGEG